MEEPNNNNNNNNKQGSTGPDPLDSNDNNSINNNDMNNSSSSNRRSNTSSSLRSSTISLDSTALEEALKDHVVPRLYMLSQENLDTRDLTDNSSSSGWVDISRNGTESRTSTPIFLQISEEGSFSEEIQTIRSICTDDFPSNVESLNSMNSSFISEDGLYFDEEEEGGALVAQPIGSSTVLVSAHSNNYFPDPPSLDNSVLDDGSSSGNNAAGGSNSSNGHGSNSKTHYRRAIVTRIPSVPNGTLDKFYPITKLVPARVQSSSSSSNNNNNQQNNNPFVVHELKILPVTTNSHNNSSLSVRKYAHLHSHQQQLQQQQHQQQQKQQQHHSDDKENNSLPSSPKSERRLHPVLYDVDFDERDNAHIGSLLFQMKPRQVLPLFLNHMVTFGFGLLSEKNETVTAADIQD